MKNTLFLIGVLFFSLFAQAMELSEQDVGTYVLLDQKGQPTEMFYRLKKEKGKWIAEGKQPGAAWASISCDRGCEYRVSSASDVRSFFAPESLAKVQVACIQNMAQAFCRYTLKDDQTQGGHVMMALVAGRAIPLYLRRVP